MSLRGFEAAALAAGALVAAAAVPGDAAEVSPRRDVAAVGGVLCEPARWTGKGEVVTKAAALDTGWWVVLATAQPDEDVQGTVKRLEDCGLRPFNDFSGKFEGFAPGFQVVVDGAYATKAEAERVRSAAGRCVPDAYLKWAHYVGE